MPRQPRELPDLKRLSKPIVVKSKKLAGDILSRRKPAMTPSADDIADFRKFLFDNGFTTENGSNYFRMQFDCGQLIVRLEFTPDKKFKDIEARLIIRWRDDKRTIFGKYPPGIKFHRELPMGTPVSSLDKEFVKHCIAAAKDSMEEIETTLQKIPAIIYFELMHWNK